MRRRTTSLLLTMICLFTLTLPLGAQTLAEGLWDGAITQGDGAVEGVSFAVASTATDGLAITLVEDGAEIPVQDARFEDGNLRFSWKTGEVTIGCDLAPLDDGSYEGGCHGPDGAVLLRMTLTPPED